MQPEFSITSDLAGQKSDLAVFFNAAAAAGFTAVHWCHDWVREPVFYNGDFADHIRRQAGELHLRIADVHSYDGPAPTADEQADTEQYLAMNLNRVEFCARVGAKVLVVHLTPRKGDSSDAFYDRSAAKLRAMLPACQSGGVRLAVENLPIPDHSDAFFGRLLGEFAAEGVGFCYDSGHAVITNQQHLLARHIGSLLATHLHDNDGGGDQHRLPGVGRADWPMIVRTISASDYRGTVNLEVGLPEDETSEDFCLNAYRTITTIWSMDHD